MASGPPSEWEQWRAQELKGQRREGSRGSWGGPWLSGWSGPPLASGTQHRHHPSLARTCPFKFNPKLLLVLWLRLRAPNTGDPGSIPARRARSHILRQRVYVPQDTAQPQCPSSKREGWGLWLHVSRALIRGDRWHTAHPGISHAGRRVGAAKYSLPENSQKSRCRGRAGRPAFVLSSTAPPLLCHSRNTLSLSVL